MNETQQLKEIYFDTLKVVNQLIDIHNTWEDLYPDDIYMLGKLMVVIDLLREVNGVTEHKIERV